MTANMDVREAGRSAERKAAPHNQAASRPNARRKRRLVTPMRLALAAFALSGSYIALNALVLQTERHPAPLFQRVAKAPEAFPVPPQRAEVSPSRAAVPEAKPATPTKVGTQERGKTTIAALASAEPNDVLLGEIQRELGKRGLYKGEADGRPGPATTQAIREFQFSRRVAVDGKPSESLLHDILATKVTVRDELFDLIKRSAQDDPARNTVLDVQRALNKAGYGPLTEDGQLGPSTRNALAKFEQDRKLPPKGELKGPVLRALASASGLPISP